MELVEAANVPRAIPVLEMDEAYWFLTAAPWSIAGKGAFRNPGRQGAKLLLADIMERDRAPDEEVGTPGLLGCNWLS